MSVMVNTPPDAQEEVWEVRVAGQISLKRTVLNRMNNPIREKFRLGPNKVGTQFKISSVDRIELQQEVADRKHDPFTNGMLRRVDADQQEDPMTASPDVLSTEDTLDLLDLDQDAFEARVGDLNEVAVRNLLEIAEASGASYQRVAFLQEYISVTYQTGAPQKSIQGDD